MGIFSDCYLVYKSISIVDSIIRKMLFSLLPEQSLHVFLKCRNRKKCWCFISVCLATKIPLIPAFAFTWIKKEFDWVTIEWLFDVSLSDLRPASDFIPKVNALSDVFAYHPPCQGKVSTNPINYHRIKSIFVDFWNKFHLLA